MKVSKMNLLNIDSHILAAIRYLRSRAALVIYHVFFGASDSMAFLSALNIDFQHICYPHRMKLCCMYKSIILSWEGFYFFHILISDISACRKTSFVNLSVSFQSSNLRTWPNCYHHFFTCAAPRTDSLPCAPNITNKRI
jgi:hypothetical protein